MKIILPTTVIYIDAERNHKFFAKIEWEFYKRFGKKRTIPCGRTKKDKYLNLIPIYLNEVINIELINGLIFPSKYVIILPSSQFILEL